MRLKIGWCETDDKLACVSGKLVGFKGHTGYKNVCSCQFTTHSSGPRIPSCSFKSWYVHPDQFFHSVSWCAHMHTVHTPTDTRIPLMGTRFFGLRAFAFRAFTLPRFYTVRPMRHMCLTILNLWNRARWQIFCRPVEARLEFWNSQNFGHIKLY